MSHRLMSHFSFENEALLLGALAILFCGAVILGVM